MKKSWLKTGGIVAVVVLIVAAFAVTAGRSSSDGHGSFFGGNQAEDRSRVNTRITDTYKVVEACDVFTLSDAQAVLGGNVEAVPGNGRGRTELNGILTTHCAYSLGTDNVNDMVNVGLLVRAAQNADGAAGNENEFSTLRASGATQVKGYGDAAFWAQQLSQLNIKVENNWYIISNTKGSRAGTGSLEQSKAVADEIISKL